MKSMALGFALLFFVQPAHAQAPAADTDVVAAQTAQQDPAMVAWLAWYRGLAAIMARDVERMGKVAEEMKAMQPHLASPAKAKSLAPRLKVIAANAKADLVRSATELAALRTSAPPTPPGMPVSIDETIGDALRLNREGQRMLDTNLKLLTAVSAGDVPTMRRLLPAAAEATMTLFDSRGALFAARSRMVSDDPAGRLAMLLMSTLYSAMADTMRIAIFAPPPFNADVSVPRSNLVQIAKNARKIADAGSIRITSELAEIDNVASRPDLSPANAAMLARLREVKQGYGSLFGLAGELAIALGMVNSKLGVNSAADAAMAKQSMTRLADFELQATSIMQKLITRATAN